MKIAICENCKQDIFQNDEGEWLHTHSNTRICSYDFAIPVEGTIQNRMESKTIGELPRHLLLVTDSQESAVVKEHVGPAADEFDSFFVATGEGEYTGVWGFERIVPWNYKRVWRVL